MEVTDCLDILKERNRHLRSIIIIYLGSIEDILNIDAIFLINDDSATGNPIEDWSISFRCNDFLSQKLRSIKETSGVRKVYTYESIIECHALIRRFIETGKHLIIQYNLEVKNGKFLTDETTNQSGLYETTPLV